MTENLKTFNLEWRYSLNMRNRKWLWLKEDDACWRYFNNTPGEHLPDEIIKLLSEKDRNLVIQAGGNSGFYSSIYAEYFKSVITFEPDNRWFCCLTNNVTSLNVYKFNCALGKDNIPVDIKIPVYDSGEENLGGGYIVNNGNIPKITLDSLEVNPDLIHLDIEGSEWDTIIGAKETIMRARPYIVVEWDKHSLRRYGWKPYLVEKLFDDLGYKLIKSWKRDRAYAPVEK